MYTAEQISAGLIVAFRRQMSQFFYSPNFYTHTIFIKKKKKKEEKKGTSAWGCILEQKYWQNLLESYGHACHTYTAFLCCRMKKSGGEGGMG